MNEQKLRELSKRIGASDEKEAFRLKKELLSMIFESDAPFYTVGKGSLSLVGGIRKMPGMFHRVYTDKDLAQETADRYSYDVLDIDSLDLLFESRVRMLKEQGGIIINEGNDPVIFTDEELFLTAKDIAGIDVDESYLKTIGLINRIKKNSIYEYCYSRDEEGLFLQKGSGIPLDVGSLFLLDGEIRVFSEGFKTSSAYIRSALSEMGIGEPDDAKFPGGYHDMEESLVTKEMAAESLSVIPKETEKDPEPILVPRSEKPLEKKKDKLKEKTKTKQEEKTKKAVMMAIPSAILLVVLIIFFAGLYGRAMYARFNESLAEGDYEEAYSIYDARHFAAEDIEGPVRNRANEVLSLYAKGEMSKEDAAKEFEELLRYTDVDLSGETARKEGLDLSREAFENGQNETDAAKKLEYYGQIADDDIYALKKIGEEMQENKDEYLSSLIDLAKTGSDPEKYLEYAKAIDEDDPEVKELEKMFSSQKDYSIPVRINYLTFIGDDLYIAFENISKDTLKEIDLTCQFKKNGRLLTAEKKGVKYDVFFGRCIDDIVPGYRTSDRYGFEDVFKGSSDSTCQVIVRRAKFIYEDGDEVELTLPSVLKKLF